MLEKCVPGVGFDPTFFGGISEESCSFLLPHFRALRAIVTELFTVKDKTYFNYVSQEFTGQRRTHLDSIIEILHRTRGGKTEHLSPKELGFE